MNSVILSKSRRNSKKFVISITKNIKAPKDYVYNWCTDFREDDPKITGSSSKRIILEKKQDRAVYCAVSKDKQGKVHGRAYVVKLRPPNSWFVKAYGNGFDTTGQYKLARNSDNSTRLSITFEQTYYNTDAMPTYHEKKLDSEKSWGKYVSALESDYHHSNQKS